MISRIRRFGSAPTFAAMLVALWLAGCATQETASNNDQDENHAAEEAGEHAAEEAGEHRGQPEVFFTNVEDGGTYGTSTEIIFGVENLSIVPIEDPLVARPGEGHYHLAVDVDCVTAGEIIPPGTPSYIHFGSGADRITMQFEPGEHRLCLQVADGEHRVIDGPEHSLLTKEIHLTVAEQ